MSAEISFTKRAAAELSRCFNGLSTSVARSNSSTVSSHSSSSGHGSGTSGSLSSIGGGQENGPTRSSSWKRKSSSGQTLTVNGDVHDKGSKTSSQGGRAQEILNGHGSGTSSNDDSKGDQKKEVPSKLEPSRIEQFKGLFNNQDKKDQDKKKKEEDKKRRNSSAASFLTRDKSSSSSTGGGVSSFSPFRKSSLSSGDKMNVIRLFGNHKPSADRLAAADKVASAAIYPIDKSGTRGGIVSTPGTPRHSRMAVAGGKPAPAPPRKTSLVRCKNFLIGLNKPRTIKELFTNQEFLMNLFKRYFGAKERSVLIQVCSFWRDILYNDPSVWKDTIFVINCNELRLLSSSSKSLVEASSPANYSALIVDPNDIKVDVSRSQVGTSFQLDPINDNNNGDQSANDIEEKIGSKAKKDDTFDSGSKDACEEESNNLAPISVNESRNSLDESCLLEDIKSNLYISIEMRGIDKIAFLGGSDADMINFTTKVASCTLKRITYLSLRLTSITDKGLEALLVSLNNSLVHLELSGCNEVTDSGSWVSLVPKIQTLSIMDCINIADETVAAVNQSLVQLKELNLQAYHVTDASMSYFGSTSSQLKNLTKVHLEHCWELSNQGIVALAQNLSSQITSLSIAGCSKVTDDAIEVIAEKCRSLESLNLSWCTRISDTSLEFIACDLSETLQHLVLDRCIHITDIGLGFISTMAKLKSLSARWCPQVRDFGLQTICSMKTLETISVSGCQQMSVNGLLCLVQMRHLKEIELTNCPGATPELIKYLEDHLPPTTIIIGS